MLSPPPCSAQPGPLQSYAIPLAEGTVTVPAYTPLSMSYYPYHNGLPNDSITYQLASQMVAGTTATADRLIDVTAGGNYGYRNSSNVWTGTLHRFQVGRAYLVMNRHEARDLTLTGFPLDSTTYIAPMPNGTVRWTCARMAMDHPIDSVGFSASGFHWTGNMRLGGDLVMDMVTRQIARRDSTDGWIGTMTHMRVGQPVMVQTNNPWTFDWTYNPTRE